MTTYIAMCDCINNLATAAVAALHWEKPSPVAEVAFKAARAAGDAIAKQDFVLLHTILSTRIPVGYRRYVSKKSIAYAKELARLP